MKINILPYILTGTLTLLASGCGESFLELTPPSSPVVDQLYKSDRDFRGAVLGSYDALQSAYRDLWQMTELRVDNADHRSPGYPPLQVIDQLVISTSEDVFNNTWLRFYQGIGRANLVLEKLPDADKTLTPNAAVFGSEAKFLRALCYYNLTMLWGDVPLVTTSLDLDKSYAVGRSPQTEVLAQVVNDLLDAEKALPIAWTGAEQGRATKGAAQSLLGKVYLTQKNYAAAEAKLREVVVSGTYALLPDIKAVFDLATKRHKEYIFDIEYVDGGIGEGSDFPIRFIPNHAQLRTNYNIVGVSGETLSPTDEYMALFDPADKRIPVTFTTTYKDAAGKDVKAAQPYTLKYLAPMPVQLDSRVNWKVLRYADVLLLLAEALAEQNKLSEALLELNKVRTRAGVPLVQGAVQADVRAAIAKERRLELGFEGHRWFDLVRTGAFLPEMTAKKYPVRDFMMRYPIPQQQIDIVNNQQILPQNAGW